MSNDYLAIFEALALIAVILTIGLLTVRRLAMLFTATFIGGFILWMFTTYQHPVDPQKFLIPYIITVIFFIVHVYEEYRAHIEKTMSTMLKVNVTQTGFLSIAGFLAPVIWLTGLVLVLNHWQFGYFLVSTFYFGMMFGELSHFAFPFVENGKFHYSAGMYTALLPVAAAWYGFLTLIH